jgi:proteasome lid subunit RPN8/RPN11
VRRAPAGAQAALDLSAPPVVAGAVVVATFHTHPNPSAEGWKPGPSAADTQSAWLLGVPCLIRADDGVHTTGPSSRRGGLAGGPGYPP